MIVPSGTPKKGRMRLHLGQEGLGLEHKWWRDTELTEILQNTCKVSSMKLFFIRLN